MSNYAPGWYPDGSGRYAQRYYDGSSWTEHVLNAAGQNALDPVPGVTVPQAQSPAAQPVGGGYQAPSHQPAPQPAASTSRPWGEPPASGGYQPSSGTSASSFQFGNAPTHDSAYATPAAAASSSTSSGSFRLTIGMLAASAGLIMVALAVLALAYWSGNGFTVSLGDISKASGNVNGLAGSYASVGRWLGLLVMVGIVAVTVLDGLGNTAVVAKRSQLTIAVAVAGGIFALWHLVGLFVAPDPGNAAIAGFVGVIGYAAGAASGYLRQPLG